MDILKNKRGLSPLVSTFLLTGAAILIGIIIMNFGRAALEETAKCSLDTEIKIVSLNNEAQVCYAGYGQNGVIHFIVENGPATDISKLHFRVIGDKGVLTKELEDSKVDIGGSIIKDIPYDFDEFGNIKQVKISPFVVLYPDEPALLCAEQGVVLENIKPCR